MKSNVGSSNQEQMPSRPLPSAGESTWLRKRLPLIFLVVIGSITMILLDRPLVRGDGVAYLAWIDTLVLDRDIDFANQLERLQAVNTYQISWNEKSQRLVNIFPFGVSFLQAPFYLLGHLFLQLGWWNVNPDYFRQMQGVEAPYSYWLMIGANLMALASLGLAWHMGRRLTSSWTAALVAWAMFLGSPLVYYSTVSPLNSHGAGALTASALIYMLMRVVGSPGDETEPRTPNTTDWILLGLFGGLMVLVRWQLLMVAVTAFGLLAWNRCWKGLAITMAVSAFVSLPLPLIWQQMFGQPVVVPYQAVTGNTFLDAPRQAVYVLVETPKNSPMLLLSVVGLAFLWRINRQWTVFAGATILLQVIVNGMVLDYWGGETYGVRRMAELYPIYVLLACAALGRLPKELPVSKLRFMATRVLLALLVAYSILYLLSFFSFTWTNPDHLFTSGPETMIPYFLNQPDRWRIMGEIVRTHLGPPAWSMPGP